MTSILVTSSNPEEGDNFDHIFSIDSLLSKHTYTTKIEVMNRISGLDIDESNRIPYQIFWGRFAAPMTNNIVNSILLYNSLEEQFCGLEGDIGEVVCHSSVPEPYSLVIEDIAREFSASCVRHDKKRLSEALFKKLNLIFKVILLIMGRMVSLFVTSLQSDSQVDGDIVVFPAINRLKSTLPVLKEFENRPTVLVSRPIFYQYISGTDQRLSEFNPRSVYRYLTFRHFIEQVRDLVAVVRVLRGESHLEKELVSVIEEEFGVHLSSAVPYLVTKTISDFRFIRALQVRRSIHSLFSRSELEKVVVGTLDPIGRAIIHGSIERQIQVFHIPHSIATTYPPNPPAETIQFTSGKLDNQYYEQVVPESLAWDWVPLGRPYISDLYQKYNGSREFDKPNFDPFEVLIATQPGEEAMRVELVSTVINSMQSGLSNYKVTIKTHPDEDTNLYQRVCSEYDFIEIKTDALFERVQSADLVVTINSNVGLESMVIGTPCVCYNPWHPRILDQTFAIFGDVPVFRSKSEIRKFFEELDNEYHSLKSGQRDFVEDNYRLVPTVSKDIAEYICKS